MWCSCAPPLSMHQSQTLYPARLSKNRFVERGGDNPPVTVTAIFGPTASGKSAVAEAIAGRTPAELVSADAMKVYRGLPILTNLPTAATRLVPLLPLTQESSA